MKLAGLMQKSYFMGRKAWCRKASLKKLTSPEKSEGWKMKMGPFVEGIYVSFRRCMIWIEMMSYEL